MRQACIVSTYREINGVIDASDFTQVESDLQDIGFHPVRLVIDSLRVPWDSPLENDHFRSGCAPIQAIHEAKHLIENGTTEAVIIEGEEYLKTGYGRDARHGLMGVYGNSYTIPDLYTQLAHAFMARHSIDDSDFKYLAELLFRNYKRTFLRTNPEPKLDEKWFEPITDLFRGVDCANPLIDFSGKLIICEKAAALETGLPAEKLVQITGTGLGFTDDGVDHFPQIACFSHLEQAYYTACRQANIDFTSEFLNGKAVLEVYTCYPVIPLAFLFTSRIASSVDDAARLLENHEVTVTGGMNLARAPWNNPALNALITMYKLLVEDPSFIGAVHGNGGLGFAQGVAILKSTVGSDR